MSKITISIDNTSDLTPDIVNRWGFKVVHFGVVIGDKVYSDSEVRSEDIYDAVENKAIIPKTNAALEVDYRELFEKETANGGSIIHFNLSGGLSASHENAKRAAKGLDRVYVIDSRTVSVGTAYLAILARRMVDEGKMSAKEIADKVNDLTDCIDTSVILKDLKYVHLGGRVSGLKLFGANLLKIRPSLYCDNNGKFVQAKKFKGDFAKCVQEWTQYKIAQNVESNKDLVFIAHTQTDDGILQGMVKDLKSAGFQEVIVLETGTVLTTHCGKNMLGMVFYTGNKGE